MKLNRAIVEIQTIASIDDAFVFIAPVSLPAIFTGYGPLPAVTETKFQTGDWDAAGQTRTVVLSDNSTARETLNSYRRPIEFSYTVDSFSGSLRFLVDSAQGEWLFTEQEGGTSIRWTYTFNARSIFVLPLVWFVSSILWRGYMRKALGLAKSQLEVQL